MKWSHKGSFLLFFVFYYVGCANITTPTGGKKDKIPPKLVLTEPGDSLLNTRVNKLVLNFDEYITVADAATEVQISPLLPIPLSVVGLYKHVTVKIVDSLLDSNTTYRISFGKSIKDLHEGNPFKKYTFIFSTGAYFDSMQLSGTVVDAATGLADTSAPSILLYPANGNDSDVTRKKPRYTTKADNKGNFRFDGLPYRYFRLYAVKESNNNLIYDAVGEKIAFNDSLVIPHNSHDSVLLQPELRMFLEKIDTSHGSKKTDSLSLKTDSLAKRKPVDSTDVDDYPFKTKKQKDTTLFYNVNIDTSNITRRSFDFANDVPKITFNKKAVINKERITLLLDSEGVQQSIPFTISNDTLHPFIYKLKANLRENTNYILKLPKGFAKDTAGNDVTPSKYKFRTFEEDDYGRLKVHIPAAFFDTANILRIDRSKDSVYLQKLTDSVVNVTHLRPDKYTFRIIVDKNHNGVWDTGDLFGKVQPEIVIPHMDVVDVKAGWEMVVDFSNKPPVPDKKDKKEKTGN